MTARLADEKMPKAVIACLWVVVLVAALHLVVYYHDTAYQYQFDPELFRVHEWTAQVEVPYAGEWISIVERNAAQARAKFVADSIRSLDSAKRNEATARAQRVADSIKAAEWKALSPARLMEMADVFKLRADSIQSHQRSKGPESAVTWEDIEAKRRARDLLDSALQFMRESIRRSEAVPQ